MPKKRLSKDKRDAIKRAQAARRGEPQAHGTGRLLIGEKTLQDLYDATWALLDEEWHRGEKDGGNSALHDALQESRNRLDFEDKAVRWVESEMADEKFDHLPPINDDLTLNRVKRCVAEWAVIRLPRS